MDIIKEFYNFLISKEVINNEISSIVSGLLMYLLAAALRIRLPNVPVLLFWKDFSKELAIVASEVKTSFDPQMRAGSTPSLLLPGEVVALGEMLHFFRSECKTDPHIVSVSNDADFDRSKDKNLFLLGGPKYNSVAREFLQEISDELFYQPKRLLQDDKVKANDPEVKVFVGKNASYPNFTYDFQDEIQYATIVFRKDLYVSGKQVLFIAGLSNASSLAGVTWILTRPFSFWLRVRKQRKGFQAIIKCRVIDQAKASKIELAFYQELP